MQNYRTLYGVAIEIIKIQLKSVAYKNNLIKHERFSPDFGLFLTESA
jgi:hypothetical protein